MRSVSRIVVTAGLVCTLICASAQGKPKVVKVKVRASSESAGYPCSAAMDGNPGTFWHTQFGSFEPAPPHELIVDLGAAYEISGFGYTPRPGATNGTVKGYEFYVSDSKKNFGKPVAKGTLAKRDAETVVKFTAKAKGRYLKFRALSEIAGKPWASCAGLRPICDGIEFRTDPVPARAVRGAPARAPHPSIPEGKAVTEADWQYYTLVNDIRNRRRFEQYLPQTSHPAASILPDDRDPTDIILRRARVLLADLKADGAKDTDAMAKDLAALAAEAGKIDVAKTEDRRTVFDKVLVLRRKIAFANPLLNFDKLLFIKRHRSRFNHMCDQYYAINQPPGGSVFELTNPFGDDQKVRDILADSVVQRGRLKGKKLNTGSVVSPDLSYDGKQVLFAYVESTGSKRHDRHTDPSRGHWDREECYHIFRVNVDGSGLEQLTDGTFNDFDPVHMPNGRVVFVTERRGGYLRCGRTCPTYTLYDMAADGSQIQCISYHETNEWHPSVTHSGLIVYTRWDYVDRYGCTAHMPWTTTPDGRDARAVHGNFSTRGSRPDMELDIRAIPGSNKYTATAAPHHGQAFGSLVTFNPRIKDDDRMAPLKRITPDVAFPETQGGSQTYGSAWPLSDKYFLCVYDAAMRPNMGFQGRKHFRGNYGIYLVDVFGNKVLVYRDPKIACLSPMPLRPRTRPPVIPDGSTRVFAAAGGATLNKKAESATLSLVSVYDSLMPWPEGTRITDLRIYQIIPMSVPSGGPPHEIGHRVPTGRDSVILARNVLGTVPVETDGSAHFTVPAHRELFFQALNADGLAVQSMRSATYLQANENLTCQGCHEPRHLAPASPKLTIAMRRDPSVLKGDVDGSNPFSYPRLVQPVLDKKCVGCHTKNNADPKAKTKAPDLGRTVIAKGRGKWYASYHSLAAKYGFFSYGNGLRTTPGKFGAMASKLYPLLTTGSHKDRVKLSAEELHRIALWLDSCSIFYGVYEKEGGEAQLRGEIVHPTLE